MLKRIVVTNYRGESMDYYIKNCQSNPDNLPNWKPPETSGMIITSIDGLGPVKANINMTELTTTDGSKYNSARLTNRNIVIKGYFASASSIENARLLSYKYFPIKKKVTIRVETDNRTVETDGYVESNEPDIFSKQSGVQISIVCEKSFFRDVSADGRQLIQFSNILPLFEFEFGLDIGEEIEFGDIEVQRESVILYSGDVETGFKLNIRCMGDVENVIIMNDLTGEMLKLNTNKLFPIAGTASFIDGDEIVINTHQGEKSVYLYRSGHIYNIINLLDKNPTWFVLQPGENLFSYTATTGVMDIRFSLDVQNNFEGV